MTYKITKKKKDPETTEVNGKILLSGDKGQLLSNACKLSAEIKSKTDELDEIKKTFKDN